MHAYNRLPSSGHNSPSSPPSPLRFPRLRHGRSKAGRFTPGRAPKSLAQRVNASLGSYYLSSSEDKISIVWKHSYKGGHWRPCINKSSGGLPESNGYILVEANGGLNQQRTSICNAVAVAGYLNATLVIPHFHYHSIWRDPSKFGDIYDDDYFVRSLENNVRVVDKIPEYIMERFDFNVSNVYNFRVKAWASVQFYRDTVLPKLLEEKCQLCWRLSPNIFIASENMFAILSFGSNHTIGSYDFLLLQTDCHLMLLQSFSG